MLMQRQINYFNTQEKNKSEQLKKDKKLNNNA